MEEQRSKETLRRIDGAVSRRIRDVARAVADAKQLRVEAINTPTISNYGATPDTLTSRVSIVHDLCRETHLFVKIGPPVKQEIRGYKLFQAAHFAQLAIPEMADGETLVLPWLLTYRSLHEDITRSDWDEERTRRIIRDLFIKLESLWGTTYSNTPSSSGRYKRRLSARTEDALRIFRDLRGMIAKPIRLNGVALPSIARIVTASTEILHSNASSTVVLSHGDLHPRNIMVSERDETWLLIDLTGADSEADFVWDIAKMTHFSQVYAAVELLKDSIDRGHDLPGVDIRECVDEVVIEYDLQSLLPTRYALLTSEALRAGSRFAEQVEDRDWFLRYAAHLFSCLWGGVPHHAGYSPVLPVLIGEAVRLFVESVECKQPHLEGGA